jgi:hypothetical protein
LRKELEELNKDTGEKGKPKDDLDNASIQAELLAAE